MDLVVIAGQITLVLGSLAAIGVALRWLWRASRAVHRLADDLLGDDDRPSLMTRVVAIEAEMRPNHGSSLRDALDDTRATAARVERRLDEHLAEHGN